MTSWLSGWSANSAALSDLDVGIADVGFLHALLLTHTAHSTYGLGDLGRRRFWLSLWTAMRSVVV